MNNTYTITADHITYTVKALPKEQTNNRLWFINKMRPVTEHDWETAQLLSIYWYYTEKLKCEYNAVIHRKIKTVLGNDI